MKIIPIKQKLEDGSSNPEWLAWRKTGITATDVAAILGLSRYNTVNDIYAKKIYELESHYNPSMKRGNDYEDIARKKVSSKFFCTYEPLCVQHDEYEWALASLDGYCHQKRECLEIKVPNPENFEKYLDGEVDVEYIAQMQWHLFTTGSEKALFAPYSPELDYVHETRIYRDDAFIESARKLCEEFWFNHIVARIPPPDKKIRIHIPELEELSREWEALDIEEKKLKKDLKPIEKRKDEIKKIILKDREEADFLLNGRIHCKKTSPSTKYDTKKMASDGIDIYTYAYQEEGHYRLTLEN